ncbi:MAG TPA: hypothetical protein VLV54_08375, partial [Thermoanaerobaculia bacterium]|nr:hypothetical protein [Thermoanaerobaculia bacterium]
MVVASLNGLVGLPVWLKELNDWLQLHKDLGGNFVAIEHLKSDRPRDLLAWIAAQIDDIEIPRNAVVKPMNAAAEL